MRITHLCSIVTVSAFLVLSQSAQSSGEPQARGGERRAAPAAETEPARGNVEHGRYIAEHVAMCVECHSGRDGQGNLLDDRRYRGGIVPFSPPWPNDWATIVPPNRGLPGYDDAQAFRLLTEGAIGRDGRRLRLPMPRFRMSRQDAADVIAFLRSAP